MTCWSASPSSSPPSWPPTSAGWGVRVHNHGKDIVRLQSNEENDRKTLEGLARDVGAMQGCMVELKKDMAMVKGMLEVLVNGKDRDDDKSDS